MGGVTDIRGRRLQARAALTGKLAVLEPDLDATLYHVVRDHDGFIVYSSRDEMACIQVRMELMAARRPEDTTTYGFDLSWPDWRGIVDLELKELREAT